MLIVNLQFPLPLFIQTVWAVLKVPEFTGIVEDETELLGLLEDGFELLGVLEDGFELIGLLEEGTGVGAGDVSAAVEKLKIFEVPHL